MQVIEPGNGFAFDHNRIGILQADLAVHPGDIGGVELQPRPHVHHSAPLVAAGERPDPRPAVVEFQPYGSLVQPRRPEGPGHLPTASRGHHELPGSAAQFGEPVRRYIQLG